MVNQLENRLAQVILIMNYKQQNQPNRSVNIIIINLKGW